MTTKFINNASNVSSSEYLQVVNNAAGLEYGVKAALAPIPEAYYPDNPAKADVIPHEDSAYASISKFMVLLFSLTNVAATWESGKRLYYAENKNLETFVDFGFNFLKTAAWFTFLGLILGGAVLIAPYLLIGMAALGIAYGTFNIGKHLVEAYRAHKEKDKEKRAEHLEAIPAQMLITALNALGLVFAIDVGLNLSSQLNAAGQLSQAGQLFPALAAMKVVGAGFQGLKLIFCTLAAVGTLGAISSKSTWDMNVETLEVLRHPQQAFRQAKVVFVEKCKALGAFVGKNPLKIPLAILAIGFEAVSLASQLVSRTIAFVATPLLLFGTGLRKIASFCSSKIEKGCEWLFGKSKKASTQNSMPISNEVLEQAKPSTDVIKEKFAVDQAQVRAKIETQLKHLNAEKKTPKIDAKKELLEGLHEKLSGEGKGRSVDAIENAAKKTSSSVYQSFWRTESKTAELVREVRDLDKRYPLAAAGA